MPPISILHAPRDEALGEKIAAALTSAGHPAMRVGAERQEQGAPAVDGGAAIVVWTAAAEKLAQLHRQARAAMERGALIPVAVGGARAPGEFENLPPVDLSGWTGSAEDPRWRFVLEEVQLTTQRMGLRDADLWAPAATPQQETVAARPPLAEADKIADRIGSPPAFLARQKSQRRFSAREVAYGATAGLVAMTVLTAVLAPVILPGLAPAPEPQLAQNRPLSEEATPDPSQQTPSILASVTIAEANNQPTDVIVPPAPITAPDYAAVETQNEAPPAAVAAAPASVEAMAAEEDAIQALIAEVTTDALIEEMPPVEVSSAGDYLRDCHDCPDMAAVPAGAFLMGARPGEVGARAAELPAHNVTFAKGFAMGAREVTYAQWDACVAAGACAYTPPDHGWGRDKQPVVSVSHDDALTYVAWLSEKTGRAYRLPSEAEWEYAARAGATTAFAFGAGVRATQANFNGQYPYIGGKEVFRARTMKVASFSPNAYGLYDMHGNAWEWTADCWAPNHAAAPEGGAAVASGDCSKRVLKGGAWNTGAWRLRSAHRIGKTTSAREFDNGFRVARDLD